MDSLSGEYDGEAKSLIERLSAFLIESSEMWTIKHAWARPVQEDNHSCGVSLICTVHAFPSCGNMETETGMCTRVKNLPRALSAYRKFMAQTFYQNGRIHDIPKAISLTSIGMKNFG
mmetsp:Transcript_2324/g.8679  ORF Transcript_2324/g.8679 Transcript_2324/m.8679 type:complete len:117 (+) Transcript_2324:2456-2806(+)